MTRSEEYRAKAEGCRRMAEQVMSPMDKGMWLQLAADWMIMASMRDRFGTGQTKSEAEY